MAVYGEAAKIFGCLVWKKVDAIWCYDCGRVFFEREENVSG
jgi:hypothetical protein